MTILDRYITREWLKVFLLVLLSFIAIYLIVDFFERLRMFISNAATVGQMLSYLLYTLPMVVSQAVPAAALLSTLLTFGMFSKNNELTALKANGISLYRASVPVLVLGLLACAFVFILNEFITPQTNSMAKHVKLVDIQKQKKAGSFKQSRVWFKAKNSIYNFKVFDPDTQRLHGVSIYYFDADFRLVSRIDARSAQWKDGRWEFSDVLVARFTDAAFPVIERFDSMKIDIPEEPSDFQAVQRSADEMGYLELRDYVKRIREDGYDATRYETDLQGKIAFTFVSLLVVMIGIAFSMRHERSGGFAQGIGVGLVIGFSYWIVFAFCLSVGRSGTVPPFLAAWTTNLIFGAASVWLFSRMKT